jgi:hypothetical protein
MLSSMTTGNDRHGAEADISDPLEDLLRDCTVQVTNGVTTCTGVFLTPTMVLTSGLVYHGTKAISIGWSKNGEPLRCLPVLEAVGYFDDGCPNLAILTFDGFEDHPCVRLEETEMTCLGDPCIAIGEPPDSHRDRFPLSAFDSSVPGQAGFAHPSLSIVALAANSPSPIMAGAAVLNLRSKDVCGVLALTQGSQEAAPSVVTLLTLQKVLGPVTTTNQIFHLYDSRWAVAARDAIPSESGHLNPVPNPNAITRPKEFRAALSELQRLSGSTAEQVADSAKSSTSEHFKMLKYAGEPVGILKTYFSDQVRSRSLPQNIETVFRLIRACGVNDPSLCRKWLAAWQRARAYTGFEHAERDSLLFRLYIPSDRLYAAEAGRLLSLFRDWLVTTHGRSVRQSGYRTPSGEVIEFFSNATIAATDLEEQFDSFSNFLALCAEDPSAAAATLASLGLGQALSADFVARFGKEVRRLQRDLTHQRERRILEIQHSIEEELVEVGSVLQALPRAQLRALIDTLVPGPSAPDSLALVAAPQPSHIRPTVTVNQPQIIYAVGSAVFQHVRGGVHLGPQTAELLTIIDRFGGQEAATLESDLRELDDPAAPQEARSRSKERLKKFVGQLPGASRDIAVDLLERLVARSLGLGG